VDAIGALLPLLLFGGFYALVVRPQRARMRTVQAFQAQLGIGQRVMTTAGIHGTVTRLDGDLAGLEVAPGVSITIVRAALVQGLDNPADAQVAAPGGADDTVA
jgi:preprotein translocase subunit YajC